MKFDHDYPDIYCRQPCGDADRLVVGPRNRHVKLLDMLSARFPSQRYYVLYVLLLTHTGRAPGRYQSPTIESHEDLQLFLWTFQDFFEGDGRHHLWVASPESNDLLVYDQHNVIFAYGDTAGFEDVLIAEGLRYQDFWFPCPHGHLYHPSNTAVEDELMAYFDWAYFELQPGDEWE